MNNDDDSSVWKSFQIQTVTLNLLTNQHNIMPTNG